MKYLVVVNRKYIVSVEANSAGGAEHKILDGIHYGIETCQAFSPAETGTDMFKWFLETSETISMDELMERGKRYAEKLENITYLSADLAKKEKEIAKLAEHVETIKKELKHCQYEINGIF